MNDLAVLTPPFLVAAAVITAIVAFLRHEMGRKRADRADVEEVFPAPGLHAENTEADNAEDSKSAGDTHTASASAHDAQL
jgi:hypothetical protein